MDAGVGIIQKSSIRKNRKPTRPLTRRRVGLAAAAALMLLSGLPLMLGLGSPVDATPAGDGNPDLASSCGLDVTLVLDDSGSIDSTEAALVRSGAQSFADALVGTPSRLKTVVFSTRAQGVNAAGSLTSDKDNIVFRDPALYTAPTSGAGSGGTNWDDGLEVVRRSPEAGGDLVVFLTDGDPTYRNESTPDGHADDGSHDIAGDGSTVGVAANLSQAVTEANTLKASGTHMFGLGVGLSAAASEQRLNDVTGDEEMTLPGGVPTPAFSQADYIIAPNFTQLQAVVTAFVRELCGDSLNVTKWEQKADGTTAKATAGAPWNFTANLSPAPTVWDTPPSGVGASASLNTDANGGASFSWDQGVVNHVAHTVDLTETAKPGWVYNGAVCTANDLQGNSVELFDTVGTNAPGSSGDLADLLDLVVEPYEAVNCEVYNRQLRTSTIQVAKTTSPAGLPGDFTFDLTKGATPVETITGVSHGETASFGAVGAGTYTVAETAASGFTQTGATCDNLVTGAVETASPVSLVVGESQNWKCTFTNTAQPGSITIVKNTVGADGTFNFTSNIPSHAAFGLTTAGGTASTSAFAAPVGTYNISETVPAQWALTNATCTGGDAPSAVNVGPAEAVVCTFTNTAPAPTISVTKSAGVSFVQEPGGNVTYTVNVTNTSVEPLEITELTDSIDGGADLDLTVAAGPIVLTDCDDLVGDTLAPGASGSCTFVAAVAGNGGTTEGDEVTVTGVDSDDNEATDSATASVDIVNVAPAISVTKTPSPSSIAEPGGSITYTVGITNTGVEPVTISSLSDSIEGGAAINPAVVAGVVTATTCNTLIGSGLAPTASTSCTFTVLQAADFSAFPDGFIDDIVTVNAADDDGPVSATASAKVAITDTLPKVTVVKTALPTSVAETAPGAVQGITYTVSITNDSTETATIDAITDSVDGAPATNVAGTCDDLIGTPLAAGATTSCTFTANVSGQAGDVVGDVVEVTLSDNEGNEASDDDPASVTFTDVGSSISVTKTAGVETVAENGGPVTYTVGITNTSVTDTITLGSITDAVDGGAAVPAGGTCGALIGTSLAPGASTSCAFTLDVEGNAGDVVLDTVAVAGTDDDGNPVSDSADESVAITDLPSSLTVEKLADVASLPEPGGLVTYTVTISNPSVSDSITIDAITDSVNGGAAVAVAGTCDDLIGTVLAPTDTIDCTFTGTIAGAQAGDVYADTVTVDGTDDDDEPVTAQGSEVVDITDTSSSITVTKEADQVSVPEPGANVTYTVTIKNTSATDAVTIDKVTDSVDGAAATDVAGTCDDLIGTVLAPGAEVQCEFTMAVAGDAGDAVPDTVTVSGTDDDDRPVSAQGSATVGITDVLPTIDVTKTASPTSVAETGPGGSHVVTYTVDITNTSVESVRIDSIVDSVEGAPAVAVAGTCDDLLTTLLAGGASTSCTFTMNVSGDAGDSVDDVVTVTAHDNEENQATDSDPAAVAITDLASSLEVTKTADVASVNENGGPVTYTVGITNTSVADTIILTSIVDAVDGGVAGAVAGTCDDLIGTPLAPGASTSCEFTLAVVGNAGDVVDDRVTVSGIDDDQDPVSDSADESVAITDLAPSLSVTKTANVASLPEPGGPVTYTVDITNTSVADTVTIDSITDAVDGGAAADVAGTCDDLIGTSLAPGASTSCTFTMSVSGNAGDTVSDVVVVSGTDDDDDPVSAQGTEAVDLTDVASSLQVAKTANVASVNEPGGPVTYTVDITNTSATDTITLDSITDSVDGGAAADVAGTCDDLIGTTLAPGASTSCTFTMAVAGDAGDIVGDTVVVSGTDDDDDPVSANGSETVDVTDVLPTITVDKTALPVTVPETAPGATTPVTFTVSITNTSIEPVTIDSIVDAVDGGAAANVAGTCDDLIGTSLAAGATTNCTFTGDVSGFAGGSTTDVVTVTASDNEDNDATDDGTATVRFTNVGSSLLVEKTASAASIPEPGGPILYTVQITNTSATDSITLDSIVDSVEGGAAFDVQGTCDELVDDSLAPGESTSCMFTLAVTGNAGDVIDDIVTVSGTDDDEQPVSDSDDASVAITDLDSSLLVSKTANVGSVAENGGPVTFTVEITNTSVADSITLDSIVDSVDGAPATDVAGTCDDLIGTSLAAGATVSCTFTVDVTGNAGDSVGDTVTVSGTDDDDDPVSAQGSEVVDITNVGSSLLVSKTANVGSVPEPGANVTYTVEITNTSATDAVTIDSITDAVDGGAAADVAGTCDDLIGTSLAAGASVSCTFTMAVSGNAGDSVDDTVVVTGTDDDDDPVTGQGSEVVDVTDVLPQISVTKTANPVSVSETGPGGSHPVTYTVDITNNSVEPVRIDSILDSVEGAPAVAVAGTCDDLLTTLLAAGASTSCTFTMNVSGDAGDSVDDVVTVLAHDDEQNSASDFDDASVAITDLGSSLQVTKTASVSSVTEPGATVTYTVDITNTSVADSITITSITDAVDGGSAAAVAGTCDDLIGTTLAAGASTSCTFDLDVTGQPGDSVTDIVTVSGVDDDEDPVSDEGSEVVDVTDVESSLLVEKDANVDSVVEPGASVTYTVTITNTSATDAVTIDSITDSVDGGSATDVAGTCDDLIGTTLAAGASTSCTFTLEVTGNAGDTVSDVVVVTGTDDDDDPVTGEGSETVDVTDVLPTLTVTKTATPSVVSETSESGTRSVTYTVTIQNDSPEAVTIDSIVDSVEGAPATAVAGTCDDLIGTTLAAQTGTTCEFTMDVSGNAGDTVDDVVTVTVSDDEQNSASGDDDATVTFTDVGSSLLVTKTAGTGSVPENGGPVTFTVGITNTSETDSITIGSITDSVDGGAAVAVDGTCDDLIGTSLAPGASTSCTFTLTVSGNAGDVVGDTVTVTGTDDDGDPVSDSGDESVEITDVASTLLVDKVADVDSVPESGGPVTYTVSITNTSAADSVTIDTITDSVDGGAAVAVGGTCDDLIGTVLAPGASVTCTFTMTVSGNAGDVVGDTVTVTGTDDDDGPVSGTGSEVVDITDLAAAISITKTPSPSTLPEPGGDVTYALVITNESVADTIELDTLVDSVEGGAPFDVEGTCDELMGTDLAPGGSTSCEFTLAVTGNGGDTVQDTVTVTAHDDDPIITFAGTDDEAPIQSSAPSSLTASASAVVDITDVLPTGTVSKTGNVGSVPESGGNVVFTVLVTNTSPAESVTVTSITDTIDGTTVDLTSVAGAIVATNCATGSVLAPGGTYGCEFTYAIPAGTAGDVVTDTVAVTLTDDEDNDTTPTDSEEVEQTDVAPTITVVKDNGDAAVAAPGAPVDFDVAVTNTSFEPVTLTALTDSIDGGTPFDVTTVADPVTATTCALGGVIAPGATYSCTFTLVVSSDQAATVPDEVIATVVDDDDTPATASDGAVTTVTASADVAIDKELASDGLIPGGEGTYDLVVTNEGPSDAAGLVVVDTLPEGLTALSASGDGWTCALEPSVVTCERLELLAGASSTITLVVSVDESVAGTIVTNVADVDADTEDPDVTNNHDEEDTDVGVVLEEETPPATTPPSSPPPTVVETLARTGSSPLGLVAVGFTLLILGGFVLVSRSLRIRRG